MYQPNYLTNFLTNILNTLSPPFLPSQGHSNHVRMLFMEGDFNNIFYSQSLFKQLWMFDSYIIVLKSFRNMVKKQARSVKKEAQTSACEDKDSIFEECEEHSTIPVLQRQGVKQEEVTPKRKPVKIIAKERRERKKRTFNPEGRFLEHHRRRFWLFPFYYATLYPYSKISWQYWKPSGYFIKMGEFVSQGEKGPSKSAEQCKSFDQRQKKEIYTNVDLLQAAFLELSQSMLDNQSLAILSAYVKKMKERSEYMAFISECALRAETYVEIMCESGAAGSAMEHGNTSADASKETVVDFISNDFYEEP